MIMVPILQSIAKMFDGLSMGTWYGKAAIAFGSFLAAFYSPIALLLAVCFTFTAADMFYGIKVSCKFNRKIESRRNWSGTIIKLLDEFTVISLARLLEFAVLGSDGVFVLTGGVTVIIGLTELWSILENLNTLDPKGPWRALGKFLRKKGEDYIGTEIELNDEHTNNTELSSSELEKPV